MCDSDAKPSCWTDGHIMACAECPNAFNPRFGCASHAYRDGFNLKAKARHKAQKLNMDSEEILAKQWENTVSVRFYPSAGRKADEGLGRREEQELI